VQNEFCTPYPAGQAQAGEGQIKRWSRNKKQALIDGNLEELHRLRDFYFADSPSLGGK
jgi:predicted GIY-YIG superfamily endonuclease